MNDIHMAEAFDILDEAHGRHKPAHVVGMFSGGNDSLVTVWTLSLWAKARGVPFVVAHINTGIGVEETRLHVRQTVPAMGWKLLEFKTDPAHYVRMVTGQERHRSIPGGFPGPTLHSMYYRELKDRRVDELLRTLKAGGNRMDQVMLVTGIRRSESQRRMGYATPINKHRAQVWVNPLINWQTDHLLDVRDAARLPVSPVSNTLHMSGECLCGAMNHPGEYDLIRFFYPKTADYIDQIAAQARAAGYPWPWDVEGRPEYVGLIPDMEYDRWAAMSRDEQTYHLARAKAEIPEGITLDAWISMTPRDRRRAKAGQIPLAAFDTFRPLCVGCEARQAAA